MKILNIGHNLFVAGGSDRVLIETGLLLEDNGHEVIPYCAANENNMASKYKPFFPTSIDFNNITPSSLLSFFYNFEAKKQLIKLIENQKSEFNVAHLHIYYGKLTTSILHALSAKGIPIIQSLHEYKLACPVYTMEHKGDVCDACIGGNRLPCVIKKCKNDSVVQSVIMALESSFSRRMGDIRHIDLFLSVSEFHSTIMEKVGIPKSKLHVLHNFVDTDKYRTTESHDDYYLYFGRIEKLKGMDTLINAFKNSNHKLVIVGAGVYLPHVEALISSIDNISYDGFKNGEELIDIIAHAKCVIVPSEWYENCPMNVLEAKALSRPVIGANIGGIPELIRDGVDGYVFEPGSVQGLKEAIDKIDSHFASFSSEARKDAVERFSKEAYYKKLVSFYELTITKRAGC